MLDELFKAIFSGPPSYKIYSIFLLILIMLWLSWSLKISQPKPDLDIMMYNYGKKISLPKGSTQIKFEPIIINNGKAIARHVNLHIKFSNQLSLTFDRNIWTAYRENNYSVLEYNGGIANVIYPEHPMGLKDLIVTVPNNFEGVVEIPFWIICENMRRKEGRLAIEIK